MTSLLSSSYVPSVKRRLHRTGLLNSFPFKSLLLLPSVLPDLHITDPMRLNWAIQIAKSRIDSRHYDDQIAGLALEIAEWGHRVRSKDHHLTRVALRI